MWSILAGNNRRLIALAAAVLLLAAAVVTAVILSGRPDGLRHRNPVSCGAADTERDAGPAVEPRDQPSAGPAVEPAGHRGPGHGGPASARRTASRVAGT